MTRPSVHLSGDIISGIRVIHLKQQNLIKEAWGVLEPSKAFHLMKCHYKFPSSILWSNKCRVQTGI